QQKFLAALHQDFPDLMARLEEDERLFYLQVGSFASYTQAAIDEGDRAALRRHFEFARNAELAGDRELKNARPFAHEPGQRLLVKDGTWILGAARRRRLKSRTEARLFACPSRIESGRRFQRHSIMRRIDVWSNTPWATCRRRANGETTRHGTRNPRSSYSGLTSGARGGETWSKNPPHSSNTITRTVDDQAGLRTTAL